MRTVLLAACAVALAALSPSADTLSSERLARLDRVFTQYVDEQRIGGAVALVLQDGKPVYDKAFGWRDKEAGRRMTTDTIFRIASQTKALTSVAVLSLMEEGKLGLNDPASRFIPAFAKTTVAAAGGADAATVPAKRAITIRDLLTHTAGISYGTNPSVAALYEAKGLGPGGRLRLVHRRQGRADLRRRWSGWRRCRSSSQPGEAWVYGYNTDVLGCIVERASGMPLDELIRTRITGPLGMKDTQFFLPPAQRDRLAAVYASDRGDGGTIVRAPDGAKGQGHYVDGPRRSFAGGAGLLSTARDYARFLEMIRNGGALDGVRILSPRTVELMTTNQVGTLHSTDRAWFRPRVRDDGSLRRQRPGLGRRVRLGRRLRQRLPRRSEGRTWCWS